MLNQRSTLSLLLALFSVCGQIRSEDLLSGNSTFVSVSDHPVFVAAPGEWDSRIRERGWIIKDGDVWKMWYTGYNPDQQPLTMKLGYATSTDGLNWHRFAGNPIIDDVWVEDIMVVQHDNRYIMFAEGADDQAQRLESVNGVEWSQKGRLDVRLMNGQPIPPGPFGTPTVYFENGTWNLFYERRDEGVWLAKSKDLQVWTNVSDEPVLKPGPESYDRLMIAMNQVVKVDGKYIAVLHGTGTPQKPREWCTNLAESSDLMHWKKSVRNPLLPISENKSSGQLIQVGTDWRLYTMHDKVNVHLLREKKTRLR